MGNMGMGNKHGWGTWGWEYGDGNMGMGNMGMGNMGGTQPHTCICTQFHAYNFNLRSEPSIRRAWEKEFQNRNIDLRL